MTLIYPGNKKRRSRKKIFHFLDIRVGACVWAIELFKQTCNCLSTTIMNTRQNQWWEKTKYPCIGIIAVCYLSSLMNLIIDSVVVRAYSNDRKEQQSPADQYNIARRKRNDLIVFLSSFLPSSFFSLFTFKSNINIDRKTKQEEKKKRMTSRVFVSMPIYHPRSSNHILILFYYS